ncbi:hypothetical protein MJN69_30260, partial [Salmonella enterica subsp. enterica serovar Kentucky]|nr:hypothetical protein [Salmonella enterica subsp. enterica serovar Kentucky]
TQCAGKSATGVGLSPFTDDAALIKSLFTPKGKQAPSLPLLINYLMQFCPDAVFRKCVIELEIAKGKFVAKARFLAEAGWRTLLG